MRLVGLVVAVCVLGGCSGEQGAAGKGGPAGARGSDGGPGTDGADGKDGAAGKQGPKGPEGAPGLSGPAGAMGADGMNGGPGPVGPQGPAAQPVSGARLKAMRRKGEDGYDAVIGIFDSAPGVHTECAFHAAADGVSRCLPVAAVPFIDQGYFVDAACTTPAFGILGPPGVCAKPSWAYFDAPADGCDGPQARTIYAPVAAVATLYASVDANACIVSQGQQSYTYYDLGQPIDPTTFVAGVVDVDP